jgi:hypothetical protein
VGACVRCGRDLHPRGRYERTGPVYDMKLWCWSCYCWEFPGEPRPVTVAELIAQLQALPDWARELPVYCSYDGGCATGVYGVGEAGEGDSSGGGSVCLGGD